MSYIFFTDPGHGWLRVKKTEIEPIKNQISHFSYMNGEYVYLEEDCDASTLIAALEAQKIEYSFREHNTNRSSKIRSYSMYVI